MMKFAKIKNATGVAQRTASLCILVLMLIYSAVVSFAGAQGLDVSRAVVMQVMTREKELYTSQFQPLASSQVGSDNMAETHISPSSSTQGLPSSVQMPLYRITIGTHESGFEGSDKKKNVITINGISPGLPIRMQKGESIAIKVTNNLEVITALHCHGIHFTDGHSWYDGGHMVTECGIPPNGGSQLYLIHPGSDQEGTFFCHSHYRGQYLDGLRFALIIESSSMMSKYVGKGKEYIANVYDWYYTDYDELFVDFLNPHNPEGIEPTPDIPLVNGKNIYDDVLINCKDGGEVAVRVINSSGLAQFYVFVDDHKMKVLEIDGTPINTSEQRVVSLGAAQRATVAFECDAQDKSVNYALRFLYDLGMFDTEPVGTHEAKMIITYTGDPNSKMFEGPVETPQLLKEFSDILESQKFEPFYQSDAHKGSNQKLFRLEADFLVMDDFSNHGTFNKIAFALPQVPSIYTMSTLDENSYSVANAYGSYTNTRIVEFDDVVTIVLVNLDAGDHPFHLHGYSFQILKMAEYTGDQSTELEDLQINNPMRSDTVVVKSMYYSVIRFRANNPGTWMFHCHVQWHLDSGLGLNIIVLPLLNGVTSPSQSFTKPPSDMLGNCNKLQIRTAGNAVGLSGIDLSGEPKSPEVLPYFFWRTSGIVGLIADILAFCAGVTVLTWYGVVK